MHEAIDARNSLMAGDDLAVHIYQYERCGVQHVTETGFGKLRQPVDKRLDQIDAPVDDRIKRTGGPVFPGY